MLARKGRVKCIFYVSMLLHRDFFLKHSLNDGHFSFRPTQISTNAWSTTEVVQKCVLTHLADSCAVAGKVLPHMRITNLVSVSIVSKPVCKQK